MQRIKTSGFSVYNISTCLIPCHHFPSSCLFLFSDLTALHRLELRSCRITLPWFILYRKSLCDNCNVCQIIVQSIIISAEGLKWRRSSILWFCIPVKKRCIVRLTGRLVQPPSVNLPGSLDPHCQLYHELSEREKMIADTSSHTSFLWTPPEGGVPTGRRHQGRCRRDVSQLAWELQEVSGVRKVWAALLRLLPQ